MTSRIMIYDFHCTLMDFFLVRVMISDLKLNTITNLGDIVINVKVPGTFMVT